MALKLRSFILDIDYVKLSLGMFFILGFLIERKLHHLSGSTFFCQNIYQKEANLALPLILAAGMVYIEIDIWEKIEVELEDIYIYKKKL